MSDYVHGAFIGAAFVSGVAFFVLVWRGRPRD